MSSDKTISVVVPTYNRAALICETLDAILGQTRFPDEVIVVDDGSTDGTQDVLARYGPKVRSIRIANSGDLAARNVGLRHAGADLVAFCDSDDIWYSDFLANAVAAWRAAPRIKILYSNFVLIVGGVWGTQTKFDMAPAGFWDGINHCEAGFAIFNVSLVDRVIRFQPFFPSCLVVDRLFFEGLGGWDESVGRTVGTDFATVLLLAEHAPFGVLLQAHVGIRKHGGNFSGDVLAMNLGDAAILDHVLARRPSLAPLGELLRGSAAARRLQALETAFARYDLAKVRHIFAMLPPGSCPLVVRMKAALAALPGPIGIPLARLAKATSTFLRHGVGRTS